MDSAFADDYVNFARTYRRDGATHSETDHVEYRLTVPEMRAFVKQWLAAHPPLSESAWQQTLDTLYRGESLEERTAAGMLLKHHNAYRKRLALHHLESWLAELHGWKEVDATCQSVFTAGEIYSRWEEWEPFLRRLASQPDLNLQRCSLVLLVAVVRSSADSRGMQLAMELMERLVGERDKRVHKAVSWVLREAVKRHRGDVEQFVMQHRAHLPNATPHEVQTKLTIGKKRA